MLLGYQQITELLDRGEFRVQSESVQIKSFTSANTIEPEPNELHIKSLANGLFELEARPGSPQDLNRVLVLVEVCSDKLTDLQKNLLSQVLILLQSKSGVKRFEIDRTNQDPAIVSWHDSKPLERATQSKTPFQLTDIDWIKINEAKSLIRRFMHTRNSGQKAMRATPNAKTVEANEENFHRQIDAGLNPEASQKTISTSNQLRKLEMHHDNSRGFFSSAPKLNSRQLAELKKHVVNLNSGQFSTDGEFTTSKQEVQAIFDRHIIEWMEEAEQEELDIVFYSHGGLTNEAWGLATAHHQVRWWKENGVYPIFFVWETGLLETIWQLIQGRDSGARGLFDGIAHAASELNDRFWETVFRGAQVPTLWAGMKSSARLSFEDTSGGAGNTVLEAVFEFISGLDNEVRLHAVGHSAGSIFVSHMIAAASAYEDFPKFESGHFLAPAISNDLFRQTLMPLVGRSDSDQLKHLSIFTMSDGLEKQDTVGPYRKSLLYLIHHALEAEKQTHILGLEHSLYAEGDMADFFGLIGADSNLTDVVFSKTDENAPRKSRSQSAKHGDFDDDASTMESVLRRIVKADDNQSVVPFPITGSRRSTTLPTVMASPTFETRYSARPATDYSTTNSSSGFQSSAKKKRALCIGINDYPRHQDRLSGCENDARQWGDWFRQAGFDTTILRSAQATRSGIIDAIKRLNAQSEPGDVAVIQYAGHGTQVPDLNGDEKQDEALVPVNYASEGLLRDDDLGALCNDFKEGVSLTLVMDCCCSGSISRLFLDKGAPPPTGDSKPRCIVATQEIIEADLLARKKHSAARFSANPYTGTNEILFAACKSNEYAYETNGSGDFTKHAIRILRETGGNLSCKDFMRSIRKAFGLEARQTPGLWCDSTLEDSGFLGAIHRSAGSDRHETGQQSDRRYRDVVAHIKSVVDQLES